MKLKFSDEYLFLWMLPFMAVIAFYVIVGEKPSTNVDVLDEKFITLSNSHTNYCASANFLDSKFNDERLQGSCCSKMDPHRYAEQVEDLKQYSNINVIPSDPYDVKVISCKNLGRL